MERSSSEYRSKGVLKIICTHTIFVGPVVYYIVGYSTYVVWDTVVRGDIRYTGSRDRHLKILAKLKK